MAVIRRLRGGMGRVVRAVVLRSRSDAGAAVAEYAITTLAAVGFAGLLLRILTGANAAKILEHLILGALQKFT